MMLNVQGLLCSPIATQGRSHRHRENLAAANKTVAPALGPEAGRFNRLNARRISVALPEKNQIEYQYLFFFV
ncbi:hypothetical protein ACQKPE_08245 [Pseudomonas sp. NPDC089554]|uniref:hypothetical protein n=1 Tax=Pseudomonas sp. NPDC089554 TaxID=3390653 RepID=UPI003CFC70CD